MSQLDSYLELADAEALSTGGAATVNIGSQINLKTARDIGQGRPIWIVGTVDTAITSGGTATLFYQLVSDASASIAVDGSQSIHMRTRQVTVPASSTDATATKAGNVAFCFALPMEGQHPYEQYIGVQQVIGTAALTAGKVNIFLTFDPPAWEPYADGI